MMMLIIKTETGSVYSIHHGIYEKNWQFPQKVWSLKMLDADFQPQNTQELYDELSKVEEVERPVVGKRMYISGREGWDYSTVIVSVDEYRDLSGFFHECHRAQRELRNQKVFGRGY
jgi:hypothetical protein